MASDVNNNVLALARDSKPIKHLSRHVIETSGLTVVQKFLQVHIDTLIKVKQEFAKLLEFGIIQPSKSDWSSPLHAIDKFMFLGHSISKEPKTTTELHRFLGLINFYRQTISNAVAFLAPLRLMLIRDVFFIGMMITFKRL